MDSWVGKFRTLRMSSSNNYLVACNFHIMYMFISPSSLLMCLIRSPQIPMGTMAAIFGYHPPPPLLMQLETVVTRCFLSSIPNPWSSHQQLAIIKSAGHHSRLTCQIHQMCLAFSHPDREHRKNVYYFLKFFYNPTDNTLFCSTVKLRKLKCTR